MLSDGRRACRARRRRCRSRRSALPSRESFRRRSPRRWATTPCSTAASTASAAPPGRATRISGGCAPAPSATPPTPSCCPRTPRRSPACWRSARPRASRSIPFGGGTSVVGGVAPQRGEHGSAIALDLHRLRGVDVDERSLTATLGPGLRGPEVEAALGERGLTLGHFPQSFEYATVGGFAATRSAGQASSGYGRFDELVTSIGMRPPAGELRTLATPAHGRGARAARADRGLRGRSGRDHRRDRAGPPGAARAPLRGLGRRELRGRPGGRSGDGAGRGAARRRSRLRRGRDDGLDGPGGRHRSAQEGRSGRLPAPAPAHRRLHRHLRLGRRARRDRPPPPCGRPGPALRWARCRLAARRASRGCAGASRGPTCARRCSTWATSSRRSRPRTPGRSLEAHYEAVGSALTGALERGGAGSLVMCHLSHAYRDGASLYFTFIAPRRVRAQELEQWREVKSAACEAIVGDGRHDHAPPRRRAPTTRPTCRPRSGSWASRACGP